MKSYEFPMAADLFSGERRRKQWMDTAPCGRPSGVRAHHPLLGKNATFEARGWFLFVQCIQIVMSYVYIYIYTCIYIYVYIYVYIYMYVCMCIMLISMSCILQT